MTVIMSDRPARTYKWAAMKICFFSAKPYDQESFVAANADGRHELTFFESHLNRQTAPLAAGHTAVCAFVNDHLDSLTLRALAQVGIKAVALRCAGYNNVDLGAARELGIRILRVPAYSPHAVAEHTLALMLALNRKLYRAYNRVREGNFALNGLLGFDLFGKTAGVVGTGTIGTLVARLLQAFGCDVLAHDPSINRTLEAQGVSYVGLRELLTRSDIVTLHCPLRPETRHLIDASGIALMKSGVMLINTGRGALIDTRAVIQGLKSQKIGSLALDVYEEESDLFFDDLSGQIIQDDVFTRLLTFPNVLMTGHQAFFTKEALQSIARTTLRNLTEFEESRPLVNEVSC